VPTVVATSNGYIEIAKLEAIRISTEVEGS
jgi:hypothetical protein